MTEIIFKNYIVDTKAKTCAVCGKYITPTFDLCRACEQYKNEKWCKELVKIEKRNYYIRNRYDPIPFDFNFLDKDDK